MQVLTARLTDQRNAPWHKCQTSILPCRLISIVCMLFSQCMQVCCRCIIPLYLLCALMTVKLCEFCKCLHVLLCRRMRGPLHTLPSKQLGNAFPWQQCKSAYFQMPAGKTWHVLVQIIGKSMTMQQFLQSLIRTTQSTSKLRAQMGRSYMRVAWCLLTCSAASKTQSATTLLALSNVEACEEVSLQSQSCCCFVLVLQYVMTSGFSCK